MPGVQVPILHMAAAGAVNALCCMPCPPSSVVQVALLSSLSNQQRSKLCAALKPIHSAPGTMLVAKGEVGDAFYIVESGICQVLGDAGQVGAPYLCPGYFPGINPLTRVWMV